MKSLLKRIVRRFGYELISHRVLMWPEALRSIMLQVYGVSLVIDVGANEGQSGGMLRSEGYRGRIVSYEPLSSAFSALSDRIKSDELWEAHNLAIGDFDGVSEINIAGNSQSSSLLAMDAVHQVAAPEAHFVGTETISVKKLDSVFPNLYRAGDKVMLKIDTQGFEKKVLDGAVESLKSIETIQLEMSFVPLYRDEVIFPDLYAILISYGYELVALVPAFTEPQTGRLLQADGLFRRPHKR